MIEKKDSYIEYTRRFFKLWAPVYDLFGFLILPVYRKTISRIALEPNCKVLDVCTGTGAIAIGLAKRGAQVTAIDITEVMLEKAKAKAKVLPIQFELADARKLPFAEKSFDISVISLGLHDMPRPVRIEVLREMARVTKRRIVICEYYFPSNSLYQRILKSVIRLFETSFFVRFADEGAGSVIDEAKIGEAAMSSLSPYCFALYEIALS